MASILRKKVILVAIGGASCSGKTVLAKHLQRTLPNSTIIHQDDFAPPEDQLPFAKGNPELRDWDDPATCVVWEEFQRTLAYLHETGVLPEGHRSHDHLNELSEVAVNSTVLDRWKAKFARLDQEERARGIEVVWCLIDGFVLYWDEISQALFDVRFFLRVPRAILQARREARQTYVTQDGSTWVDPPKYFEQVVYPAYQKAHADIFVGGDIEHGDARREWSCPPKSLTVLEPKDGEAEMTRVFELALERIWSRASEL